MLEEGVFFLPVRDHCHRDFLTCGGNHTVVAAAVLMRDADAASIVVCDEMGQPVGIMTDHDLRSRVVAGGLDPRTTAVRQVMHAPVIAVGEEDPLFEALYQMSRNRIRRIGVVDADDRLVGIINETDIIRLQNRSPHKLLRAIDDARSVEALGVVYRSAQQLVVFLSHAGVRTRDLVRLIALLNDQITQRWVDILRTSRFPDLTGKVAFLILGSEGRREQTLKTDQDNALIYEDDLTADEVGRVEAFSHALIDGLIEIGAPECPGGIMAKNPFWRRSLSEWKEALNGWIATPTGENILNFSMFSDMRTLWGDPSLEERLREHVIACARTDGVFLARMAANVCSFVPPLGFFGGIKSEKKGVHVGEIDLKKAGIFALTEGIKTLALEQGMLGGGTHDKLDLLGHRGILDAKQVEDLGAAFNLLSFLRLRSQVAEVAEGREPDNFISPTSLNRVEEGRLKVALEMVRSLEGTLKNRFQLGMMSS